MKFKFGTEWFYWLVVLLVFLCSSAGIKAGLYWTFMFALGVVFFFFCYSFFDALLHKKLNQKQGIQRYYQLGIVLLSSCTIILISPHKMAAFTILLIVAITLLLINASSLLGSFQNNKRKNKPWIIWFTWLVCSNFLVPLGVAGAFEQNGTLTRQSCLLCEGAKLNYSKDSTFP